MPVASQWRVARASGGQWRARASGGQVARASGGPVAASGGPVAGGQGQWRAVAGHERRRVMRAEARKG